MDLSKIAKFLSLRFFVQKLNASGMTQTNTIWDDHDIFQVGLFFKKEENWIHLNEKKNSNLISKRTNIICIVKGKANKFQCEHQQMCNLIFQYNTFKLVFHSTMQLKFSFHFHFKLKKKRMSKREIILCSLFIEMVQHLVSKIVYLPVNPYNCKTTKRIRLARSELSRHVWD